MENVVNTPGRRKNKNIYWRIEKYVFLFFGGAAIFYLFLGLPSKMEHFLFRIEKIKLSIVGIANSPDSILALGVNSQEGEINLSDIK